MKKFTTTSMALAMTAALGLGFAPTQEAAAQDETQYIAIGTGGPTGVYFVVGNSVCRMVHKEAAEGRGSGRKHGLRCSAPSTAGSTYNIANICAGELDFGVAQSDWQHHAYNGTSDKVTNCPGLRAVFSVHPEPYHVIAHPDSDIQSFNDLKGERFNIGNPGSGQRGTTEVMMECKGWTTDDFEIATELTSTEQSQALCDGKLDAYGYTIGVPNSGVAVATDGCGAYIVDLSTDECAQKLVDENPYYAFATIPEGTYKTTDEDVTTFGVKATFVSHESVPENVVYEVTRAVFENLDDFRRLHPAFENLDPKSMISDALSAPIHAGAKKYYKEKGWM